ncbi:DUF6252 family protein [Reichenbachiella sp.]|uniref:DUF6252 family protein n=1 Tax=Reichenbachiella sp. TaxID=2184521 RepID=UPI003B599826
MNWNNLFKNVCTIKWNKFLMLIVFSILFESCDESSSELPNATEGELLTLIDGKQFKSSNVEASFGDTYFYIKATTEQGELMFSLAEARDGVFDLSSETYSAVRFTPESENYVSYSSNTESGLGTLTISKFDVVNNLVSGSFSATVISYKTGEEIKISEGSFTNIPLKDVENSIENLTGYYFFAKVDGVNDKIGSKYKYATTSSNYGPTNQYWLDVVDFEWGEDLLSDQYEAKMQLIIKIEDGSSSSEVLTEIFKEGESLGFGKRAELEEDHVEGIVFNYTDKSGVLWSSDIGIGDQSGSELEITQRDEISIWEAQIKASFHCVLYDGNGNQMELTDGLLSFKIYQ